MAQNIQIDPATSDYVVENGTPVPSDRIFEASFIALQIPQGQYLNGTPNQGSKIYTLEGAKRTSDLDQQFAAFATDALNRQTVLTGLSQAVNVYNLSATTTTSMNNIQTVPLAVQISSKLNFIGV